MPLHFFCHAYKNNPPTCFTQTVKGDDDMLIAYIVCFIRQKLIKQRIINIASEFTKCKNYQLVCGGGG